MVYKHAFLCVLFLSVTPLIMSHFLLGPIYSAQCPRPNLVPCFGKIKHLALAAFISGQTFL